MSRAIQDKLRGFFGQVGPGISRSLSGHGQRSLIRFSLPLDGQATRVLKTASLGPAKTRPAPAGSSPNRPERRADVARSCSGGAVWGGGERSGGGGAMEMGAAWVRWRRCGNDRCRYGRR
jgi:hypothetical protein